MSEPTDLPLPDLDKLHAEAHPGEWTILRSSWCVVAPTPHVTDEDVVCDCEQTIDWDPETIGAKQRQWKANAEWIAQIHNTWPTISARLKELEAENARLTGLLRLLASASGKVPIVKMGEPGTDTWMTCIGCGKAGSADCAPDCWVLNLDRAQFEAAVALDGDEAEELIANTCSPEEADRRIQYAKNELGRPTSERVKLLEETLRGVLQEKQKQRDLMQSGAIDKAGTKAGEAYEWAKGEIEREIAWLESVLGGGK